MRLKLKDRSLPDYTKAEERFNTITHIAGGAFAILALILCVLKSIALKDMYAIVTSCVYGVCMILLYCMSSVYHGLRASTGKKVLQIIDHCAIYFMIAGTYTPIALCALRPDFPALGWGIFGAEWVLAALATTLTAIDLKQYSVFSMVCYIVMGWGIAAFFPQTIQAVSKTGFILLLAGGICYSVGAILYGIGAKKRWFHGVFHVFVLAGSVLHFLCIYYYVL